MCMVGRLVARHASRSSSRRALVCCQHLPPTHTSRISHALEAQLTAAVPLVLHSTDEAEAVCGINITRNLTSEHVKPKVCNPEAPSNCRSSRSALLPCALLTSTFGDCRCSSERRVSHKRSCGASYPPSLDTASTLVPSVGGASSWMAARMSVDTSNTSRAGSGSRSSKC